MLGLAWLKTVFRAGHPQEPDPDISATFDAAFYLNCNGDVAAMDLDPLAHFLEYGWREGRNPAADFDVPGCLAANPTLILGEFPAFWAALLAMPKPACEIAHMRHLVAPEFDGPWYCSCFADGDAPSDPLGHYLSVGWREDRDPAPWFSGRHYLARNPDVVAAGVNPFVHYLTQGRSENRPLAMTAK